MMQSPLDLIPEVGRQALREHVACFGRSAECLVRAPGRVNLIGEHVDYHDGVVLPFAIDPAVWVAAAGGESGGFEVHSLAQGETVRIAAEHVHQSSSALSRTSHWAKYVRGILGLLAAEGRSPPGGATLWIGGDLPSGAGLSSSAALCISVGLALTALSRPAEPPSRLWLAELARRVEHEFVGTPCGIMDPYACCFGRAGFLLRLDCRARSHEYIPFDPPSVRLMLIPSGARHTLADGAYENRVTAGMRALRVILSRYSSVHSLRDVAPEDLEACRDLMDEEEHRRARHVVSEMRRVDLTVSALRRGELATLGQLLSESHVSLRDDYETSCPAVERLWGFLAEAPGVYGVRMVGGGFGGMLLALVDATRFATLGEQVRKKFLTAYEAAQVDAYPLCVRPADGAAAWSLSDGQRLASP